MFDKHLFWIREFQTYDREALEHSEFVRSYRRTLAVFLVNLVWLRHLSGDFGVVEMFKYRS